MGDCQVVIVRRIVGLISICEGIVGLWQSKGLLDELGIHKGIAGLGQSEGLLD
jgi:hypothetical protein